MNCSHIIPHQIQTGDTLYQLARYYQTTVPEILTFNPGLNPYNLQVGSTIAIPSGPGIAIPANASPAPATPRPNPNKQMALVSRMRLRWSQHIYWTRMLLISIADHLKDQPAVTAQLMQNPRDIADIFEVFYNRQIADIIADLLTEHLQIGAQLILAIQSNQVEKANELDRQWTMNANKMANAFSSINPYYDKDEMLGMLRSHLNFTRQEISARLAANYPADIEAFNHVEAEAMLMADVFSSGLMQQFPQYFV